MSTHYEVLGVRPSATPAQVRRAYYDQARQLHPDHHAGQPGAEQEAARHAMQDLNEAWRILRDPSSRAAYDRSLRASPPRRPAPGRARVARFAPWLALTAAVGAVVALVALGRDGDDGLVGRCITIESAMAEEVPCDEPNDGRVVALVHRQDLCAASTEPRVVGGGSWFCLRPAPGS